MKFFLVDDDPSILELVAHELRSAGYEVTTAADGREALARIPAERPDCVITDLMMPGMDGFELTRELRNRPDLAAMKIVVLSSKTYDFDRRRAKELGADGYITKPVKRETLLAQLDDIVKQQVVVAYWGVHGTLPVTGSGTLRYGGNTPCISVDVGGGEPLSIFDCGTGIKKLSDRVMATGGQRFSGRIFISHPHWDHINTIPFFAPLYVRGNQLDVFGPYQGNLTIDRVVSAQMESVYFPVTIREFGARLTFRDLREESLDFGAVKIDTMLLKHPGNCLGYRLRSRGATVCYVTDNEFYEPDDARYDPRYVERLAEFVKGADVLITDTTYRDHEYPSKVDWGHSSVSQVARFAAQADVKRLHLFHHDPDQDDEAIDRKTDETREALVKLGSKVPCESPAEGSGIVLL